MAQIHSGKGLPLQHCTIVLHGPYDPNRSLHSSAVSTFLFDKFYDLILLKGGSLNGIAIQRSRIFVKLKSNTYRYFIGLARSLATSFSRLSSDTLCFALPWIFDFAKYLKKRKPYNHSWQRFRSKKRAFIALLKWLDQVAQLQKSLDNNCWIRSSIAMFCHRWVYCILLCEYFLQSFID